MHELELAVKDATHAGRYAHPLRFVEDAELLLARRRVERDLIEGVKEADLTALRGALEKVDTEPSLAFARELVDPSVCASAWRWPRPGALCTCPSVVLSGKVVALRGLCVACRQWRA